MSHEDHLIQSASASQWQKIQIRNHHGIVVPLFSLHSQNSCGIGEFPALELLLPWMKSLNMDVLQLLPLNEANRDNSPFSGLSAFALDPIYIGLSNLPNIDAHQDLLSELSNIRDKFKPEEKSVRRVDYKKVREEKREFLRKYLERERQSILDSEGYKEFHENNKWLDGYAIFKILKSQNEWRAWWEWPEEIQNPISQEDVEKYVLSHIKDDCHIEDEKIIQYICSMQLNQVKKVAIENNVFVKGDIPYLISRDSADVWLPESRKFFHLNYSAGAPPDQMSADGQNWGMPVYNWEELAKSDYWWWKARLNVAQKYYDIYRIDHVVGFFRVWGVADGQSAAEGKYLPEDSNLWEEQGLKNLSLMIENSGMLAIGEDLGTLPECARPTLHKLGICGTKVIIWERKWEEEHQPFIPFDNYDKVSMTTVSTHDSEPLRMWWERNPNESKAMAHFLGKEWTEKLSPEIQKEILLRAHQSSSLFHVNALMEYLPLADNLCWDSLDDERVNIPGKLLDTNWAYCYKPSVEEIISNDLLTKSMRDIVTPVAGGAGM